MFTVSEPAPPRHSSLLLKTPVSIAPDALDFRRLIGRGETVGWAEATAEPLFLTRLLDAQAGRCSPFRVFFPLTFSDSLAAGHPNVTVTALGGAGAGRRFFAGGADNVVPANISDVRGLVASGWLPIDIVLLQVSGPDDAGRYNAGLGIEHLQAAIGRARWLSHRSTPNCRGPAATRLSNLESSISWCPPPNRRSNCRHGRRGRSSARSPNTSPG